MRAVPLLAVLTLVGAAQAAITFETTYGPVTTSDVSLSGVAAFRSIPFAAPPVGNLRFRAPQPPQPWTEPLDVSGYAPPCPQLKLDGDLFIGNENCLFLSVYVPPKCNPQTNNGTAGCPVMYWIFGGGWVIGDATEFGWYEGENLSGNNDVIVVGVNYRVGPFGFMALNSLKEEDPNTSVGNAALLDQRAGLVWVRDNIKAFGGDPSKVTIFGESAGGFSVAFHVASEGSKGLFRGAIMESGTFDAPQFFTPVDQNIAFNQLYSEAVGCNNTFNNGLNDTLTLDCLRGKSTQDLMKSVLDWLNPNWPFTSTSTAAAKSNSLSGYTDAATGKINYRGYFNDALKSRATQGVSSAALANLDITASIPQMPALSPIMPWSAAIDGTSAGLKATPLECVQKGEFNKVAVTLGTNQNEGSIFIPFFPLVVQGTTFPPRDSDLPLFVEHALDMYPAGLVANLTEIVMNNYPPYPLDDNWARGSDILTDYFFSCAARRAARALSTQGVPTFLYHFTYKLTFLAGLEMTWLGDYHTSELFFVWGNQWPPLVHDFVESDWNMSTTIQTYWTNFAKTMNPNSGAAKRNPVYWPAYATASDMNIDLAVPASTNQGLLSGLCDMWDGVEKELLAYKAGMSHEEKVAAARKAAHSKWYKGVKQATA